MGVSITPKNKVYFAVQVFDSLKGRSLKALKPNTDGYYSIPLAMLDATSRNNAYYDVDSIVNEITSPNTVFNIMLTQGNLRGEYGHPSSSSTLERMDTIVEDRVSHHISRLWTGDRTEDGIPLYGEIKPTGPFGHLLEASLLNPKENTTFSLRCLMTQKQDPIHKRFHRTVRRLVTFDYVNMPGYMEASKWFAPGQESFQIEVTPEMIFDKATSCGLESWSDRAIADLFGMNELVVRDMRMGMYIKGTGTYFDKSGTKRSVVHALLTKKGE